MEVNQLQRLEVTVTHIVLLASYLDPGIVGLPEGSITAGGIA
jgi:hypothetical protein